MIKTIINVLKSNFLILVFFVGIFCFRTAIADWSPVPSSSMEPTIYPGDVLLVNRTILGPAIPFTDSRLYSYGAPQRGDIITFYPPHEHKQYVKRVIAVPGDTIRTEGLRVFVNGEQLPLTVDFSLAEQGIITAKETNNGLTYDIKVDATREIPELRQEVIVPADKYFVMGDFRNNSVDSRYWGFVEDEFVLGKVTRVMVSIAEERPLKDKVAYPLYN